MIMKARPFELAREPPQGKINSDSLMRSVGAWIGRPPESKAESKGDELLRSRWGSRRLGGIHRGSLDGGWQRHRFL